ncbi:MAG: transglycosylase domain-containing protein [Halomonas sp.]
MPTAVAARPRHRWPWLLLAMALVATTLAGLVVAEARTSEWQARELSRYAGRLTYTLASGPSDRWQPPRHGPFDQRLGYTRLPEFQGRLLQRDFEVEAQARFSPALMGYVGHGFFPPYQEKSRAGLDLASCSGEPLYRFRHPGHHYPDFEAIPPLALAMLLFIENRGLLDADSPRANPAVDWPRFARAALSQLGEALALPGQSAGGSTLATQIEKYRHSPGGLTRSPAEKIRQMVSASVRGYRDGPETLTQRRQIALDYLNSVPLSAAPGHGEVHGLGDGLSVWFGADFDATNRLLHEAPETDAPTAEHGRALRHALALMIAQRRPSGYLVNQHERLEALTDRHLAMLAEAGIVSPALRDAAQDERLRFRDFSRDPIRPRVEGGKTLQVARTRLAGLLDVSLQTLDRLDLAATTTLNAELQDTVTEHLRRLADPEVAADQDLLGERLLDAEAVGAVRYSFTLFERQADGFAVRVQTDNGDLPFDLNQGSKLELGSTAKLRVLANYLEVVAELHAEHAGQTPEALRALPVDRQDAIRRFVIDRLIAEPRVSLEALLEAAMQRRYSAIPHEAFFTGGGRHTFGNFRREDNARRPTLDEALRESINLPFVRLMRDLVQFNIHRETDRRRLLEDDDDPRRLDYLRGFADREGRVFLQRFWRKYHHLDTPARLEALLGGLAPDARRLAAVFRYLYPEGDPIALTAFLAERLGDRRRLDLDLAALHERSDPSALSLSDQGYIAGVHPLELWLVGFLIDRPDADYAAAERASRDVRQEVYGWLFKTRHRGARDSRIRTMLEVEAFLELHHRWERLGYPFDHLVPSLATALGSSGDRPAALAELVGIILNDGIRLPTRRLDSLHFAADTPYETRFVADGSRAQRVMAPEVAATLRRALSGVVEGGTARRLQGTFLLEDGTALALGGKTGTGDNRFETVNAGGQVLHSEARSRTATFAFYLGDDHFGTLTAYVPGSEADAFRFTSALPVQVLKGMAPLLTPYLAPGQQTRCRLTPTPEPLMADDIRQDNDAS